MHITCSNCRKIQFAIYLICSQEVDVHLNLEDYSIEMCIPVYTLSNCRVHNAIYTVYLNIEESHRTTTGSTCNTDGDIWVIPDNGNSGQTLYNEFNKNHVSIGVVKRRKSSE